MGLDSTTSTCPELAPASSKNLLLTAFREIYCDEKVRIQPFHFPTSAKEGHKVQVICGLLEGDPPVHFIWQKNGESVSTSNNVNIMTHPDFSRLVINDVDVQSSGNYTCIAKNNQGQDSYTAHLAVRGPPKWLKEPTDTSTSVGESVTLPCATFGYPTPDVTWRKANDSSPDHWMHLVNNRHIRLESNGSLTIINVQNEDSGHYQCQVSNGIGEGLKKTVSLSIKAPPKWIKEPQDASVGLEGRVSLDCEVRGHPKPRITWTKIDGDEPVTLKSKARHHLGDNGSLIISDVKPEDAGRYECHATNEIGNGLKKEISLSVHVPARFENKFQVETVRWGETAILHCEAFGDKPITLTWTKSQMPISEKESTRYEVYDSTSELGTTSELHVQVTDREDNGLYVCIAKNAFGKDERTVKLVVLEVPGPPSDVRVEQTWSQSATVRWNVPYGGNSPITFFVVQYWRDAGAPHRLEEEKVSASQTFTMLKDLQPGTSYVVRVLAENEVGRGNPSESQQFLTKEAEPSAPPTDVTVEPRGAGTLRVKWKTPPREQWNGQLKGYYIGYQVASSTEHYSFKTVEFSKQVEEEYRLTNLLRSTEYKVIVQAFNSAGSGPPSQAIIAKTSDTDPPSPPFLWVDFQSRSSIGLKWKHKAPPPSKKDDEKEETPVAAPGHYTLYYKDEYGPWSEITVPRSAEREYTLSGLREGTRYQIYMKATSEAGDSDSSDMLTVRTEGGALSDMSSHPIVERGEDTPIYLRLSVIAPLGSSVGIILLVLIGACFYVRREEKRYKAAVPGGPDRRYSYCGSSTLPHPQRYKDVDKNRPLLRIPGVPMPPHPPPEGYPAPYATMPIRCGSAITTERRRPSEECRAIVVGKNGMLHHATMDRKRMAGLTIQETAEVHHYDMAA
ncbi:Down syndrome cell adhesion molecule like protein [Argiope bruennichi]|uniref:Down syndrome cell adhesion molecule like protein n=1 Tax=Argiope bruennichi TaxID=94029 RepID=A0A8T0FSI6_ARGBR|nr:Down syndrome cell adhesion molecule like protein [Argiope bruennichi]